MYRYWVPKPEVRRVILGNTVTNQSFPVWITYFDDSEGPNYEWFTTWREALDYALAREWEG